MNLLIILLLMPILTTPFRLPPSLHPSLHPPPSSTSLFISRARAADALLPWLVSQKGSSKSFTLTKTPKSNDIEIYATAPLESNTVVLSTPADLALTISDADSFPPPSLSAIPSSVYAELPWYSKMSLTLHALNSTDPNYAPWFASLPPPFLDTPFHWTTGQLLSLEYSPMNTAVLDQTRLWRGHYESVKQYIVPSLDFDSYVHNCELARSRMFSATKQPAFNPVPLSITLALVALTLSLHLGTVEQAANGATLILCATIFKDFVFPKFNKKTIYVLAPVCDMANHDATTPNCAVSFEYFQNSFSLATTSPIAANEELRISYGPRSNDQLLQYYGFVIPDNPDDVYLLRPIADWDLSLLESALGGVTLGGAGRLSKMERAMMLDTPPVVTRDGIDPAVRQAIRALTSDDEEWAASGESVGNFAAVVSEESERKVDLCVKIMLQAELKGFKTTIREDEETIGKGGGGIQVRFRLEKKKLLAKAISAL